MLNVLMITVDTLRFDEIHYLSLTTKLLSQNNLLLDQHYTNGVPTHYAFPALHTALAPLYKVYPDKFNGISVHNRVTLAELLKFKNYSTIAVVDNPWISKYYGYSKGFDLFLDLSLLDTWSQPIPQRPLPSTHTTKHTKIKNQVERLVRFLIKREKQLGMRTSFYLLTLMSFILDLVEHNMLIEVPFIRAKYIISLLIKSIHLIRKFRGKDRHIFMWIHLMDLHDNGQYLYALPLNVSTVSNASTKRINTALSSLARYISYHCKFGILDNEVLYYLRKLRQICLKYADLQISELIKEMEKFDISIDNTIIILTSDHGEEFLEHGGLFHVPPKLYQEFVKVPFLIHIPKWFTSLHKPRYTTCHIDIVPSLLYLLDENISLWNKYESFDTLAIRYGIRGHCFFTSGTYEHKHRVIFSEYWYRDPNGNEHIDYMHLQSMESYSEN